MYLAFAVDKCSDYWCTIATWASTGEFIRGCFARQAIPMTWDFSECNAFSDSTANIIASVNWVSQAIETTPAISRGKVVQQDATQFTDNSPLISTDPPYYDNIGYADLSDFFYVWLRRSLVEIFPDLCSTLLTPKTPELIATPFRFNGSRAKADAFFEAGLGKAFVRMRENVHPDYPLTVY